MTARIWLTLDRPHKGTSEATDYPNVMEALDAAAEAIVDGDVVATITKGKTIIAQFKGHLFEDADLHGGSLRHE